MNKLLSIEHLKVSIAEKALVQDVSLSLEHGQIVAIAGGSGSGKTTIGLSILRLLAPALKINNGRIIFEGTDLLAISEDKMRRRRGSRIGMVFQEPLSAFDPLFTIGRQLDETLLAHTDLSRQERYQRIVDTLSDVELTDPKRAYASYPHQLSGGMRQRAMVAQAIICEPSLIIADEPTSNLDATLQIKIMQLFKRLKSKNLSILLIAHDLGMIAHLADHVVILKEGLVVESGQTKEVMAQPQHDYTKQLIEAFQ